LFLRLGWDAEYPKSRFSDLVSSPQRPGAGCPRSGFSDLGKNNIPGAPSIPRPLRNRWETTNLHDTGFVSEEPIVLKGHDFSRVPGAPSIPRLLRNGWESTNIHSTGFVSAEESIVLKGHDW
jgi:hypothetical protein